ncbi:MAG: formate/nitrite transporter family protein [Clostridia bacterium]|nr:formate/nitrite transporter family protein [Clostridia bacterium]
MRKALFNGIAAGFMIGIGAAVFLSCDNKVIGAVLFAVALTAICQLDMMLFTGKIGYIVTNHTKADVLATVFCLIGNAIGTCVSGLLIGFCRPALPEIAKAMTDTKLSQAVLPVLVSAVFCGILMYTAVAIFKEKGSMAGIVFCVPVFILSGFEHSIADMAYFWIGQNGSMQVILFTLVVICGNTIGGCLIPVFKKLAGK